MTAVMSVTSRNRLDRVLIVLFAGPHVYQRELGALATRLDGDDMLIVFRAYLEFLFVVMPGIVAGNWRVFFVMMMKAPAGAAVALDYVAKLAHWLLIKIEHLLRGI